ncbi:sodium:solute symporter [Amorphus sp. 3PC139-8]|uniref:sodium:solute symporter n=1 Tax=Amorphus sp. 3PC139-8 TaxID=2735676 RepID=UPI00345D9365
MENAQFSFHWVDYAIVVIYFAAIIAHGVYVSRRVKSGADGYFLAGRALPWYLIGFSLYASNMSGSSFVGLMGGAYENGIAIFNYEWTAALVLVFFAIFILPSYLRAKVSTVPEYLEHRYGVRSRRAFSAFTLIAIMFIDTAGALYAGGLVISNAIEPLSLWQASAALALVAGLYTILGGLSAVVVTDTVQAIVLMAGSALIFGFGLAEVGGWTALMESLSPEKRQLILPADNDFLPWTGLWGVILLGFYYWTLNQFVVQRTLGARDLREGRRGSVFAGFLKLPNLFLMVSPGLIAFALYPDLSTPDLAFPKLAFELMPVGVQGLILAALIAAIMSSLDSALNSAGTLFTLDFVKPLRPNLSEKALVAIGKVVTGVAMVVGAIYAPLIAGFESLFSYFQSSLSYVVPAIVVVYLAGLFWRGGNDRGAFWTIFAGIIVGIPMFLSKEVFDWWTAAGLPDIHYTVMSSFIMIAAILLHVGLSLTAPRPGDQTVDQVVWNRDDFAADFAQVRRPILGDYKVLAGVLLVLCAVPIALFW